MSIFKVSDKVMHCREGLSEIVKTTEMGGREYFVVRSIKGDGEAIYVPVENSQNIIRPIMTVAEADGLIKELKGYPLEYNPNTKQRRDAFKRRLNSGNIRDVAYLFYQGYLYSKNPDGIKLGPSDSEMLIYSKNFLFDELALVYKIVRDKIEEFILRKLKED